MAGWATSQSCACTTSGRHGRSVPCFFSDSPARIMEWPIASVQAIMSLPKVNSCGSCAAAITRTPSTDLVGRRVGAGIGARGTAGQHDDVVTGRGQRGRQVMHVATQPADHHRRVLPRHHEDLHAHPFCRRAAPTTRCCGRPALAADRRHRRLACWPAARLAVRHRGSLRASRAPNSPSARFHPSASRCAVSRRPDASAPAISRVACACRWAR